jgi:hypothetical protein
LSVAFRFFLVPQALLLLFEPGRVLPLKGYLAAIQLGINRRCPGNSDRGSRDDVPGYLQMLFGRHRLGIR